MNPSCQDNPQKHQMDHIQAMLEHWLQSNQPQAEGHEVDVEDAETPAKKSKQGQASDIEGFK